MHLQVQLKLEKKCSDFNESKHGYSYFLKLSISKINRRNSAYRNRVLQFKNAIHFKIPAFSRGVKELWLASNKSFVRSISLWSAVVFILSAVSDPVVCQMEIFFQKRVIYSTQWARRTEELLLAFSLCEFPCWII